MGASSSTDLVSPWQTTRTHVFTVCSRLDWRRYWHDRITRARGAAYLEDLAVQLAPRPLPPLALHCLQHLSHVVFHYSSDTGSHREGGLRYHHGISPGRHWTLGTDRTLHLSRTCATGGIFWRDMGRRYLPLHCRSAAALQSLRQRAAPSRRLAAAGPGGRCY